MQNDFTTYPEEQCLRKVFDERCASFSILDQENKVNAASPQGKTNNSRGNFSHIMLVCFIKIEEKSY